MDRHPGGPTTILAWAGKDAGLPLRNLNEATTTRKPYVFFTIYPYHGNSVEALTCTTIITINIILTFIIIIIIIVMVTYSKLGTARLSNSWIISKIWLYIALNRTPNIDCYWVGAVPKF